MRFARVTASLMLFVALAHVAHACTLPWRREIELARKLSTRQWFDVAEIVLKRLEKCPDIIGIFEAELFKGLGDYYSETAVEAATGKDAMGKFVKYLNRGRDYYKKFVNHPSIKGRERHAPDRFAALQRVSWISIRIAEGHIRLLDDPEVSEAAKKKHKAQALRILGAAIKEFKSIADDKARQVAEQKRKKPAAHKQLQKWRKVYEALRQEEFTARLYYNDTRVRLAKFLKKVKEDPPRQQSLLKAAEREYVQMLLHFVGNPAADWANLRLAQCLIEQGARREGDALKRLDEVWEKRKLWSRYKLIPCEALFTKASVLLRQKKHDPAIDAIDDLLKYRTRGAWPPKIINDESVRDVLQDLEGSPREQFGQKAAAGALKLQAEAYAAKAKRARTAKKPRKVWKRHFEMAYYLLAGVGEANIGLGPKYSKLMERARKEAGLPVSIIDLRRAIDDAIRRKEYAKAARLYTEFVSRTDPPYEQKRELWWNIALCYFFAERYYEAYIVFSAVARWFPKPESPAYKAAQRAVAAASKQYELTRSSFGKKLLEDANRDAEALSPLGPAWRYIKEAIKERKQAIKERKPGLFDKALDTLKKVRPASPAYADALYHTALTRRAKFESLPEDERKGPRAQLTLKKALGSFQQLFDHFHKKHPELKGEEHADARQRLTEVVAAGLAVYTGIHFSGYLDDPEKVLELTAGLAERFPGVDQTTNAPVLYFNRMRAAYLLILREKDAEKAAQLVPIINQMWTVLQRFPEFRSLDRAAAMGAQAHINVAEKLEALAKKTPDAAEKAKLHKRVVAARDRGLEFYLELIEVAPRQRLATYRYILYHLRTRKHEPKSRDYRKIVEIAPKVIELFKDDRRAAEQLFYVKITLGVALAELGKCKEAIPVLEEVHNILEGRYQKEFRKFKKEQAEFKENPKRFLKRHKRPPKAPLRYARHPEVMDYLALCYLEGKVHTKYQGAARLYDILRGLYARDRIKSQEVLYRLCETLRRLKRYGDVLKFVGIALLRGSVSGSKAIKDGKGSVRDFRELIRQLRREIPKGQKNLIDQCDEVLRQLGQLGK